MASAGRKEQPKERTLAIPVQEIVKTNVCSKNGENISIEEKVWELIGVTPRRGNNQRAQGWDCGLVVNPTHLAFLSFL